MYRWDPGRLCRVQIHQGRRHQRNNNQSAPAWTWADAWAPRCTASLTCSNINPIVWRFRYRALTNPSSRLAFYLFWVVSQVEWIPPDGLLTIEREMGLGLSLWSHMARPWSSISANLLSSVQSSCILSTIHDSKTFLWQDIYINKSKILHQ